MKIGIPVTENKGLQSQPNTQIGSAPVFVVVDTETGSCHTILNSDEDHQHGMCHPLGILAGESLDCVVVAGIGAAALSKLQEFNIRVFMSDCPTVEETIEALEAGSLTEMKSRNGCAGRRSGPDPCEGHWHTSP